MGKLLGRATGKRSCGAAAVLVLAGCAAVAPEADARRSAGGNALPTPGPGPTAPPGSGNGSRGLVVADFGPASWDAWENVGFNFWTRKVTYRQERGPTGYVALAESQGAASMLVRRARFDARTRPVVRWSWKVAGLIPGANIATKDQDDAPARVYFAWDVASPSDIFKAKGLAYVWGTGRPVGKMAASPFTDREGVVILRSGAGIGRWTEEERDILAD